MKHIQLTKDMD